VADKQLSPYTHDLLLVTIASGLAALLKAAAAGDLSEDERETFQKMGEHMNTIATAATEEMGL
jgi:hypothetical protein